MKILRKGDDFKKMSEESYKDVLVINNLIYQGWNYCPKQIYKDFFKSDKKVKEEIAEKEAKEAKEKNKEDREKKSNKKLIKK